MNIIIPNYVFLAIVLSIYDYQVLELKEDSGILITNNKTGYKRTFNSLELLENFVYDDLLKRE